MPDEQGMWVTRAAVLANPQMKDGLSPSVRRMTDWSLAMIKNSSRRRDGHSLRLDESARELVWILETWGFTEEAQRLERQRGEEFAEQMTLPF